MLASLYASKQFCTAAKFATPSRLQTHLRIEEFAEHSYSPLVCLERSARAVKAKIGQSLPDLLLRAARAIQQRK